MSETAAEINAKLEAYRQQYEQVIRMLMQDSSNEDLQAMKQQFAELISVTEELYNARREEERVASGAKPAATPAVLPVVPDHIGLNCRVRVKPTGETQLQEAVVITIGQGTAVVKFSHSELVETHPFADIKPYTSVQPETRKRPVAREVAIDEDGNAVIPEHLRIRPTDTEEEKARKKAKIHSIKSAGRLQVAEQVQDSKKNSWQKFAQKKAVKKVMNKESIFRTSESGRVGVTGSGQSMTEYGDRGVFRQLAKTSVPILPAADDEAQPSALP